MTQILLGLSHLGQVQYTELHAGLPLIQLLSLAHARLAEFSEIQIWEETVCVLRLPPDRRGGR